MKKIFLDTNFIIDLLVRDGEVQVNALRVLEEGAKKNYKFPYLGEFCLCNQKGTERKVI